LVDSKASLIACAPWISLPPDGHWPEVEIIMTDFFSLCPSPAMINPVSFLTVLDALRYYFRENLSKRQVSKSIYEHAKLVVVWINFFVMIAKISGCVQL
jgi:hypothetical protein